MWRVRTAVLWLALAACSTSREAAPGPLLHSVTIAGTHRFSAQEIESHLATQPPSWWPFAKPRHFDEAAFQGDLERIVRLYQAAGYFGARVTESRVVPQGPDAVSVVLRVDEGQPSHLRALTFRGLGDLGPLERAALTSKLPLAVGEVFTESAFQAEKTQLLARLREDSFAGARVTGHADVHPETRVVDVEIQIETGRRDHFGPIRVAGNQRVPAARIEREIRGEAPPGALFHASSLEAAQARLFDLGVFSGARVEAGEPDPATGTVPVEARVHEAPFHTLSFGGGIGIDVEHQELHLTGDYTDRDFLGGLRRLDFDNRFALVWIPSVFAPTFAQAAPAGRSSLQLTQPHLFTENLDLVARIEGERAVEQGYDYWALRGRLALPYRVLRRLTLTLAYDAELAYFQNAFNGVDLSPNALLQTSCPENGAAQTRCLLSYLEQSVDWDTRDNPLDPHRGFYAAFSVQEGGGPLGGNFSYLRLAPELRAYFQLFPGTVLAARVQAGVLLAFDGTGGPITQRFFAGGIDSVRGYGALRLSPMARINTCVVLPCQNPGNSLGVVDIPVGGDTLLLASLELRQRLTKYWELDAFVDAGEVEQQAWSFSLSPDTLAITPGLGVLFKTPIGPLRIDFAYRLTDPVRPVVLSYGITPSLPLPGPAAATPGLDTCPYPYFLVPQTGWGSPGNPYSHPSTCSASFLNRFIPSLAIGEAF
ncbi:MAG: BamA/OMP85 family outer membrane protein [Myxococcales bacterium]